MYQTYRIFDTIIASQIALPELPVGGGREPFITARLIASGQFDLAGFTTCHDWRDGGGRLIARTARRGADYLSSFPAQASFLIAPDGVISCVPEAGVGERLVRQLLLNQVLPRYLAHTGELLLHASAVTLPNGATVALLGESGYGKSTLASYCHQQGAQIIDDDCILLRTGAHGVSITGGVPTIRLYPDSLHALSHDPAAFVPYVAYSDKQQMRLAEGLTPGAESRVLNALYLLDAPGAAQAPNAVRIEPATGRAAVMAIVNSAFNLDPSDHDTMTRTFLRVTQTLQEALPVYHLHYPREHARLPQVLQALLGHTLP
jgi:hypothetical protein